MVLVFDCYSLQEGSIYASRVALVPFSPLSFSLFQRQMLAEGVEIVTSTVGRLMDMIESRALCLDHVRFFVLDEADRLLDTGNRDSIRKVFRMIPKMGGGRKDRRLQVMA